jgi:RIO-like serine/threonine protein kinase
MKAERCTTARSMKRILDAMKENELIPLPRLAKKTDMHEPHLRRALRDMAELSLVIQLPLPKNKRERRKIRDIGRCTMGWKKTKILIV